MRAVAGDRAHYGPLQSVLHEGTDPVALAKAGLATWGLPDLYLADLDAILGEAEPAVDLYRQLVELGLTLWIDSGVKDLGDVPRLVDVGVERVIVGLETVRSPQALRAIIETFGPDRVVFSLDLRGHSPMVETLDDWGTNKPRELAERVVEFGVRRIILLDLAAVGTGRNSRVEDQGQSLQWLADLGLANEGLEWLVGGGIVSAKDLAILDQLGACGALIGSALHDGTLTTEDLKAYSK